jgi:hypothetical protein
LTLRSSPPSSKTGTSSGSWSPKRAARSATRPTLTTVYEERGSYRFAVWNEIMFVKWDQAAEVPAVAKLEKLTQEFRDRHPASRQSGVHLIADGVGLPTPEARTRLMALIKGGSAHFGAVAIVIAGTGFGASAVRSFLTGLRLVAPRSFDFRLHSRTYEVLKWFPSAHEQRTGQPIDVAQFGRALSEFELDTKA